MYEQKAPMKAQIRANAGRKTVISKHPTHKEVL